ncbi:MAG: AI-2E family transporter [Oligoflexia bacterium]|nr:AI-2E family transporter [Oligoflexia bacterium]
MFKNKIEREIFFRFSFLVLIAILCVVVIFTVSGMLGPILLSAVATYLLYPVINIMERHRINRAVAILIVYLILSCIIFFIAQHSYTKLVTQFSTLQTDMPDIFHQVIAKLGEIEARYSQKYVFLAELNITSKLQGAAIGLSRSLLTSTPAVISSLASLILLVPFYTFFLLLDGSRIKRWILAILPNRYFESGLQLLFDINRQMGGFIQARLLEAAIVGAVVYIGLLIAGVKYALFLAVFAGLLNLVPYIGPFIGALPGLAVAYFYTKSGLMVGVVSAIYLLGQLIDIIFVIPLVFSKIINIHPMLVVVLIIIGSDLMGIVGMILAVPVFCILKAMFNTVYTRIVVAR